MKVRDKIQELLQLDKEAIDEVPWAFEQDRWIELLYSVLLELSRDEIAAGSALAVRDGSRGASRASLPPCAGNGPLARMR